MSVSDREPAGAPGSADEQAKGTSPEGEAPPPPRPKQPEPFPWLPAIGIAMLLGIALIANKYLERFIERTLDPPKPPKPAAQWTIGAEADIEITLITDDARRLACASDTVIEGKRCTHDGKRRRTPRAPNAPLDDNNADLIQPYRTADTNQLVFVAGLWAQPALALRLHREPPDVIASDKLIRFVAYCRVRFIGELTDAETRWDTTAAWQGKSSALVAEPLRCSLEPPAS